MVRLTLDADWDRLEYLANYDSLLWALLGLNSLSLGDNAIRFHRRTLRDNAALLDEALLQEINERVVLAGRTIFPVHGPMEVRVDSYVVETDVHFPTDFNLLWDAARKCLDSIEKFLERGFQLPGSRKIGDWRKRLNSAERTRARASSGGGKNKDQRVKSLTREYLKIAEEFANKLNETRPLIQSQCTEISDLALAVQLDQFRQYLDQYRDQLDRRVIQGQVSSVASASFDKGFTNADNKELLKLYIPEVVMPKRRKKNAQEAEEERAPKSQKRRRAHSAVESAINALEHHGLDRCLDFGLDGYERYVGYGVLAYNLHLIGRELQRQDIAKQLEAA